MLKIEHLKKSYENFSLDCSLEVKKGHVNWFDWSKWCRKKHNI